MGSVQATEVIKCIVGRGDLLTDRLLVYNGLKLEFREFKIKKNSHCERCGHLTRKE
jgi:molybdopterin/thiamine biosynthesis adenylyltransferase